MSQENELASSLPRRRCTIEIFIGADTMEEAIEILDELNGEVAEGKKSIVSGGFTSGHYLTVIERPEVTPESFKEHLKIWMENQ